MDILCVTRRHLQMIIGSVICDRHGIYAASRALRHSDVGVTAAFYVDKRSRATTGLGGLLSLENL